MQRPIPCSPLLPSPSHQNTIVCIELIAAIHAHRLHDKWYYRISPFSLFNGKIKKICRNFWKHQYLSNIISWVSCQNVLSFWYFLGLWTAKETKIDKVTPVGKDRKLKCLLGQYIEPCWPDMGNLYIYKESRWLKSYTWPHERIT